LQRSEEEKGEKPPTSLFFSFGGEKMGLEKLDKIIEILSDEEEHTEEELRQATQLSEETLRVAVDFLIKYKFIVRSERGLKITEVGKELLRL